MPSANSAVVYSLSLMVFLFSTTHTPCCVSLFLFFFPLSLPHYKRSSFTMILDAYRIRPLHFPSFLISTFSFLGSFFGELFQYFHSSHSLSFLHFTFTCFSHSNRQTISFSLLIYFLFFFVISISFPETGFENQKGMMVDAKKTLPSSFSRGAHHLHYP